MISLCVCVRMRRGRCGVQWGARLLLVLSSCLLCVHSLVDPHHQEQPQVVVSGAHTSGHAHGRLDKNMVQDKE